MAITDIVARIEADAEAEAAALRAAGHQEAEAIRANATATLEQERAAARARSARDSSDEIARVLAGARLQARDALVAGKQRLIDSVLTAARETIEGLPDGEYAAVMARAVAQAAAGGETLMVAEADRDRLAELPAMLAARGVRMVVSAEAAPLARGVLLAGDRMRVEITPASLVEDRRDELMLVVSRTLFGGEE